MHQNEALRRFTYDEDTGVLRRRVKTSHNKKWVAYSTINGQGYVVATVGSKSYKVHRLIWLYKYGYFPENNIDHINRDKADNRLKNLREVSNSCNLINQKTPVDNTSGVKGVCYCKADKKWRVHLGWLNKRYSIGCYSAFSDAVCARLAAEQCLGLNDCDTHSSAFLYIKNNINKRCKNV